MDHLTSIAVAALQRAAAEKSAPPIDVIIRSLLEEPWFFRGFAHSVRVLGLGPNDAAASAGYGFAYREGAEAALRTITAAITLPSAAGRELEIVGWVREGVTHAEIAGRLQRPASAPDPTSTATVVPFPATERRS